jgi:ribosomal protein L37AE/L43A
MTTYHADLDLRGLLAPPETCRQCGDVLVGDTSAEGVWWCRRCQHAAAGTSGTEREPPGERVGPAR